MKKIIGYRLFAIMYRIGCLLFKTDFNRYFCVMTHDGSAQSSVGVVITAIAKSNEKAEFSCFRKENKSKKEFFDLFVIKPFALAKAGTVLLDNEFLPMAYIKLKSGVKVVQLWHGTGTIKKFGHDISSGKMLAIVERADSKITHLIVNSKYTKKLYSHTFGVAPERVYITGIPRTDMLFDGRMHAEMKRLFYEEYPELAGKKLVLYAPTFRDSQIDNPQVMLDFKRWAESTPDDMVLLLRLHPFVAKYYDANETAAYSGKIYDMGGYGNLNTLLCVSDVLITDYSSIIFEYIVFDRPIIFYAYDLAVFENGSRGFYEDYRQYVPGAVVYDMDGLIKEINGDDIFEEKRKKFLNDAYEYKDGRSTERLLELIL
ncbi:MAG: hypothetical protein HFH14_06595 [Lachnospiraceae bacterium]|nr:hypothetical protein [Lachnospiraceae bacterium]